MTLAVVTFEEAIGPSQDTVDLQGFLHVLGADEHSGDTSTSYVNFPILATSTLPVYSYERWVRARFDPGFLSIQSFRFYAPTLVTPPNGWTFNFGVTDTYATPVNTPSAIATSALPTSDPGRQSPNSGGAVAMDGTTVRYSKWIVIQAVIDPSSVNGNGPAFGYDEADQPNLIEYEFTWTESEQG